MSAARVRAAIVTFCVLAACAFALFGRGTHRWSGEAFAAFYCAGEAIAHGADPYRIEPLRSCERRHAPTATPPDVAEPAPLPGYALAPFVALSHLSYRTAATVFVALTLGALALSVAALAELTGLAFVGLLGALLVVGGFINVWYGESPMLAIGALCVAALCLVRGRQRSAAAFASLAMLEPHLGVAACASLFVWVPRTRPVFLAFGVGFAALSFAVLPSRTVFEYFTQVLPLQTRAETSALDQYSLTWLVHLFGASDDLAARLGSLSFIVLFGLGVATARSVARAFAAPALLVLYPCAVTMLFGVFVHDLELPAAVPAALVIAATPGARSRAAWIAVFALAVAWMPWWQGRTIVALSSAAVAAIAWAAGRRLDPSRRVAASVGAAALCVLGWLAYAHLPQIGFGPLASPWPHAATLPPDAQAGLAWGAGIRGDRGAPATTLQLLAGKIVVWSALLALIVAALRTRPAGAPLRVAASASRVSEGERIPAG